MCQNSNDENGFADIFSHKIWHNRHLNCIFRLVWEGKRIGNIFKIFFDNEIYWKMIILWMNKGMLNRKRLTMTAAIRTHIDIVYIFSDWCFQHKRSLHIHTYIHACRHTITMIPCTQWIQSLFRSFVGSLACSFGWSLYLWRWMSFNYIHNFVFVTPAQAQTQTDWQARTVHVPYVCVYER